MGSREIVQELKDLDIDYFVEKNILYHVINTVFFGGLDRLMEKAVEPLAKDIIESRRGRSTNNIESYLQNYQVSPTFGQRFADVDFKALHVITEKPNFSYVVAFEFEGKEHVLKLKVESRSKEERNDSKLRFDIEYILDDESIGSTVSQQVNKGVKLYNALDLALFKPKADKFVEDHKSEITEVLMRYIRNDPMTAAFDVERKTNIEVGPSNDYLNPIEIFRAPQIKASYQAKLPSGALIEVGLKGDIFYLGQDKFGLFGYRDESRPTFSLFGGLSQESNDFGTKMIAYFENGEFHVNPVYKPTDIEAAVTYEKSGLGTQREANDEKLVLKDKIDELSNRIAVEFSTRPSIEDGTLTMKIALAPYKEAYGKAMEGDTYSNRRIREQIEALDQIFQVSEGMTIPTPSSGYASRRRVRVRPRSDFRL